MDMFEQIKSKIVNSFSNLLGGPSGNGSVIGIDIGSSSIKIVQLRKEGGKAILETYGAITLGPYADVDAGKVVKLQPAQIAEALTDLIRESNISTASASVAIPFASSLTSIIEMPNMSKDQLNKMVPLEARKYIPVPINEITMDWFVIPQDQAKVRGGEIRGVSDSPKKKEKTDTLEVLLVAIHNKILDDYQLTIDKVGLNATFYELEIFSSARGALGNGIKPVVIVDIGASTTKIYVIERGIVRMSHLIHKGSQDLTLYITRAINMDFKKAERLKQDIGLSGLNADDASTENKVSKAMLSTLDNIFTGVNKVLLSYGKKYNKNVTKVVFCGGSTAMIGFTEYAENRVDNLIEIADPFNKVVTPAFLDDILKEVGPEFTVSTGLALRQLYGGN